MGSTKRIVSTVEIVLVILLVFVAVYSFSSGNNGYLLLLPVSLGYLFIVTGVANIFFKRFISAKMNVAVGGLILLRF